jgi:hypothetical protein
VGNENDKKIGVLGNGFFLLYKTCDGVVKRLDAGRVEKDGMTGISIFGKDEKPLPDLDTRQITGWRMKSPLGETVAESIAIEDLDTFKNFKG